MTFSEATKTYCEAKIRFKKDGDRDAFQKALDSVYEAFGIETREELCPTCSYKFGCLFAAGRMESYSKCNFYENRHTNGKNCLE